MSPFPFYGAPLVAPPIILAAYVVAGLAAGAYFFRCLWWNTGIIVSGGDVYKAIAMALSRFFVMGGLLTIAALQGAAPLLAAALGAFIGRFFVLRALGSRSP